VGVPPKNHQVFWVRTRVSEPCSKCILTYHPKPKLMLAAMHIILASYEKLCTA